MNLKIHFLSLLLILFSAPTGAGERSADQFDIYLLIGQSNMAGRGPMTGSDTTQIIDGVWLLNAQGEPEPARAPLNRYSTIRKEIQLQQIGIGAGFGEMMHRWSSRKILLVVNARGGSSIKAWAPGETEHRYLEEAVARTKQALQYGRLKGILWHQGETDIQQGTPNYAGRFSDIASHLRQTFNNPDLPVLVGEVGQWNWEKTEKITRFNDTILPAICREVPLCTKIHSDDLKRRYKDKERDPHFSREAQLELGRRYADAMLSQTEEIYVSKFRGDRPAAISFTFDDGDEEHATLVAPELEKRGMRGTFWIIGSNVGTQDLKRPRVTWQQLKVMADAGHEISNHSWSHPKLVLMSEEEITAEIHKNDSAIEVNTGIRPTTFCYPYNATNPLLLRLASEGRVGTRLKQTGVGQQNNKTSAEKLTAWLHNIIESGDWGITMTHGINVGYDKWYHPEVLWNFFDEVKSHDHEVWTGTFREIAAYQAERDNLKLHIRRRKNRCIITPELSLDKKLFCEPLTLVLQGDFMTKKEISVIQGKRRLPVIVKNNKLIFDFQPGGGKIRIKCPE